MKEIKLVINEVGKVNNQFKCAYYLVYKGAIIKAYESSYRSSKEAMEKALITALERIKGTEYNIILVNTKDIMGECSKYTKELALNKLYDRMSLLKAQVESKESFNNIIKILDSKKSPWEEEKQAKNEEEPCDAYEWTKMYEDLMNDTDNKWVEGSGGY